MAFALLAQWLDPRVAYTIVFAGGLSYTTVLSSRWVFSARTSPRLLATFVGWYLAVYVIGLGTVHVVRDHVDSTILLAGVTILVTAPLSFLGGRLIFGSRPAAAATEPVR